MNYLLEQWNEHVITGNRLSRELEDFEGIMHVADMPDSKVAFYGPGMSGATFMDLVLSPEKVAEIKDIVIRSLNGTRTAKEIELKKHMISWKPATINPEFEAAVQDMAESVKVPAIPKLAKGGIVTTDSVEEKLSAILDKQEQEIKDSPTKKLVLNVEDVRRMYQNENKSMKDNADYFGVTKSIVNSFIYNNHLAKKKVKDDGYMDSQVEARTRRERP